MTNLLRRLPGDLLAGMLFRKEPPAAPVPPAGAIRRQLEGFSVAIAMALLLKNFMFDTFQVPTESMEPAIIGRGELGDRILVDRFAYQGRDPERYDIVVFQYPLSRLVNYVKRAVGLPGEHLKIWRGQIFAAPDDAAELKITRKPDAVQDAIFRSNPVIPADDASGFTQVKFFKHWEFKGGGAPEIDGGAVKIDAGPGERLFENKFDVTNKRTDPASEDAVGKGGGDEKVGDVRIAAEATPAAGSLAVVVEIEDPSTSGRTLRVEVGVGDAKSRATFGGAEIGDAAFAATSLAPGSKTSLVVENVDQRINVRVDGKLVLRSDYDVRPVEGAGLGASTKIRCGVRRGAASFSRIGVFRDTHYTRFDGRMAEFHVPKDSYLMFGDNSPNSLDARGWRESSIRIRETGQVLFGDCEAVSDRIENQRRMANPWRDVEAGLDKFLDVYGNLRPLKPGSYDLLDASTGAVRAEAVQDIRNVPDVPETFAYDHWVPRKYVVGRAILVFFPVGRAGILR